MAFRPLEMSLADEGALNRVARILGPNSAAKLALDDAAERRRRGEDPAIVECQDRHGSRLLVVPRAALKLTDPTLAECERPCLQED